MKVRILYFAALRDLSGTAEEEVELPLAVTSVGAFAAWIEEAKPALKERLSSVRIARNEELAGAQDRLEEGDVLALIPPVAGGA